jgi:hypothetical protein
MTSQPAPGADSPVPRARTELRASHADRDRTVEILRIAAGDGRLTADELDERIEAALSARTYRELADLTADLPAAPVPAGAVPAEPKDLVRIECTGANAGRDGAWVVPRRMEIKATGGSVKLDFTEAVITEPALQITAAVHGGSLLLVTRPGIEVDTENVSLIGGSVKVRRPAAGQRAPAVFRIELSGRNVGGSIVARPPRRSFWLWLLRKPVPYRPAITS